MLYESEANPRARAYLVGSAFEGITRIPVGCITMRVLVVDDDRNVLFVLKEALAPIRGCQVDTASDGREALDAWRRSPYDLLITDLSLPGLSGVDLTREIRSRGSRVPVVWVTAHGYDGLAEESAALGVSCCLDKPVGIEAIRTAVLGALGTGGPVC